MQKGDANRETQEITVNLGVVCRKPQNLVGSLMQDYPQIKGEIRTKSYAGPSIGWRHATLRSLGPWLPDNVFEQKQKHLMLLLHLNF